MKLVNVYAADISSLIASGLQLNQNSSSWGVLLFKVSFSFVPFALNSDKDFLYSFQMKGMQLTH